YSLLLFITISIGLQWNRPQPAATKIIQIFVVGEVVQEQSLKIHSQATIADVLAKIQLTPLAALEKMAFDAHVTANEVLVIPRKGCVSVFIKGEDAKVVVLQEGATFQDLREKLKVVAWKRKRRKLKEGETIYLAP
ncbi:MAG: hypothetical protein JWO53_232, partial [Chlamydiia bacterium]|nr:hypothetical protein [Chlamydiia bacterium]